MRYFYIFLFVITLLFAITSCFPVQRLARDFGDYKQTKTILIIPPSKSTIFFSYYPYNPDKYKKDNDTVYPLEKSHFLKHVDDSLLYEVFVEGLEKGLDKYGIDYYLSDSVDAFLQGDDEAYVFSVAQKEMLEYPDTFKQKTQFDTVLYVQELERNNVISNTWFEFTELNNSDRSMNVLFSMHYTSDLFDGNFRMNWRTGEVTYQYTPYKIDVDDVLDLGFFAGYKNGEYIVDYLFNIFLEDQLGKGTIEDYYRYDKRRNSAYRANGDRFIIIEY